MAHRWNAEDGTFKNHVRRMAFAAGPVADFETSLDDAIAYVEFDTPQAAAAFIKTARSAGYEARDAGMETTYHVHVKRR